LPWLNQHSEVVTAVEEAVAVGEASMVAVVVDILVAAEDALGAEHASRVEEHASQVEVGILRVAAHASRHLGCVRRRRFGRVPLPAIASVARASTGEITPSPGKAVTGTGVTTTFRVAIASVL
jgi:hypothetical protein